MQNRYYVTMYMYHNTKRNGFLTYKYYNIIPEPMMGVDLGLPNSFNHRTDNTDK